MSTGAVFALIANDGKQDKLLLATEHLQKRIISIKQMKARDPSITDISPTIAEIEKTHIFFMHAHFKPYVAMAMEYLDRLWRISSNNPTASLQTVQPHCAALHKALANN